MNLIRNFVKRIVRSEVNDMFTLTDKNITGQPAIKSRDPRGTPVFISNIENGVLVTFQDYLVGRDRCYYCADMVEVGERITAEYVRKSLTEEAAVKSVAQATYPALGSGGGGGGGAFGAAGGLITSAAGATQLYGTLTPIGGSNGA